MGGWMGGWMDVPSRAVNRDGKEARAWACGGAARKQGAANGQVAFWAVCMDKCVHRSIKMGQGRTPQARTRWAAAERLPTGWGEGCTGRAAASQGWEETRVQSGVSNERSHGVEWVSFFWWAAPGRGQFTHPGRRVALFGWLAQGWFRLAASWA